MHFSIRNPITSLANEPKYRDVNSSASTRTSMSVLMTPCRFFSSTGPIIKIIQGHQIVVGKAGDATAFNTIFAIGIALMIVTIALGLIIENYTFAKNKNNDAK